MSYLVCGTFILCVAILIMLVRIAATLRQVLDLAKRQGDVHVGKFRASFVGHPDLVKRSVVTSVKGWAVWVHQDGKWKLEDNMCSPGFGPGAPPRMPGTYDGQRVKQEGVVQ